MAESLSPEEIQQAFDAFNKEFLETGRVSRGTTLAFEEAQKGIRNYTFELNKSLKALGNASLGLGQALLKGEQGASVYNNSINATADALESFLSRFGRWGKMLGAVLFATSRYVSEVNKQSDQLFLTYQKLSKVGAANASGLSSIADNVHKFGLNLNDADLEKFTSLISNNAESLAMLGGSVNQGVKTFSDMANEIQNGPLQTEFMRMGLTVTDINNGMAGYLKIQSMTGSASKMTTAQLTQSAGEYIKQLDLLTKLTGKSSESLVKEQEANLSNERYALHYRELKQKADAGSKEAQDQLEAETLALSQVSGEMKTAFQDTMAGFVTSEAAIKAFRTAPEAVEKMVNGLKNVDDVNTTFDLLKTGVGNTMDTFGKLGQATGDLNKIFLNVKDMMGIEAMTGTAQQRMATANAEADAQRNNADATISNQVAMRQAQQATTTAAENLIKVGLNPATAAMSKLAGVTEKVATSLPGTGNTGLTGTGRGTEQAPGFFGKTQPVTGSAPGASPAPSAPAPAAPAAAPPPPPAPTPSPAPPPPAPPPAPPPSAPAPAPTAAPAAPTPSPAPPPPAPPPSAAAPAPTAAPAATPVSSTQPSTGDLANLLKFTGNTGSQSNFNDLNAQLKQAVIQAGAEYNKVTGKNLTINSAKRDPEDQQRLYDETVAAGRPGKGPTGMAVGKPGRSLHERGMAVDIQQGKGDQVAIDLLNKQNLYQKVPNDPVHFQFSAREGGVLSGPKSGYSAQLHGDEAVVPLSGGRTIPVEMPALTASMNGQISMMQVQSEQLEELIELMRNNNGISSKILQASKA